MMNDKEFLIWLHARLALIHKEDARVDYMRKLAAIAEATPADQVTANVIHGEGDL